MSGKVCRLYSAVVRLQTFSGTRALQFTVMNPELYQKLDFMVFQLIIAHFISYNYEKLCCK